ncbi:TonB-dependent receptor [Novosphingobium flavum]|uniref:TonB-dependent receptor n=1 Tax=Novosphingobium flavum TaxID=1778672 RepID=A0A7X1FNV2_9SPHN|nr:TonB-dependent receptor [Novosphingobium flavum]MBC2664236.1 TonB-dependent receptor [Novosphingobium flavum]
MPKLPLAVRLAVGASALTMAVSAHAQAARQPASQASSEDIVVTGSRTIKNGDDSPSPVTVASTQDLLQTQPGSLSNALNVLPVFAGSRTTSANPFFNGSATGGNSAANNLNLRNLGPIRTLVLMDGNRVPPTTFNNLVDVDIIPAMLVQRVETVTGGVSAVYGSDAVAGVVNYIIDKKFTGVRFEAEKGISERGDAPRYQLGLAWGTNLFGGRGHLEMSAQIIDEEGIPNRSARPNNYDWGVAGAGTAANPFILLQDITQASFAIGGKITNSVLANQYFSANGVLSPFVAGGFAGVSGTAGSPALQIGGSGARFDSTLVSAMRAKQFFARYDHEFGDNISGYAQFSGDIKTNQAFSNPIQLTNSVFSAANPFLPSTAATALNNANQATFTLSEIMGNFARLNNVASANQYIASIGLTGSGVKFKWDVNYTHGASTLHTAFANNINNQRLAAALDVVQTANGPACYAATQAATAAAYANCKPLNVFGPTAADSAALWDYVFQATDYRAVTLQDSAAVHLSGSPVDLPAGPLDLALSAEWRKMSFHSSTDANSNVRADCTGLRFNCNGSTFLWGYGFAGTAPISQTVKEAALEVNAPLMRDSAVGRALSVNGAVRYTDYDTSGSYWTWKAGLVWEVTDTLRFRGTVSRDIRAPTLYEQFAPINSVPVTFTDLLTNTSPRVPSSDLANPNLKAEIGHTLTGGFTWKPLPGFSFTVDAYRIKLKNAVAQISGFTSAFQNLCYASGGTSEWCALQIRPGNNYTSTAASNAVTGWYVAYRNLASIETSGVDVEANYASRLFDRPFSLRLLAAYQPHVTYEIPNVPTFDQGNAAFGPTGYSIGAGLRLTGFVHLEPAPRFAVDIMERWRSSMKLTGDPTAVIANNHVSPFATTNLTLSYSVQGTFMGDARLSFNVSNLFDAKPPAGAGTANGTRSGGSDGFVLGDDVLGRYYSLSFKTKL